MFRITTRVIRPSHFTSISRPVTRRFFTSNNGSGRQINSLFKSKPKTNNQFIIPKRSLNTTKKTLVQSTISSAPSSNLNLILGGVAALGLAGLAAQGFLATEDNPTANYVRTRMRYTYLYLGGSLGFTAVVARTLFQSGFAARIAQVNPWVAFGVSFVGLIGANAVTRMIPFENSIPKHLALGTFCTIMGATLCPLVAVGGTILTQAAFATGTIVGSLSFVGATAPEGTFTGLTGPLTIGLGCLMAASIGTMIFPTVGILHNVIVYGGTALFGLFVLHDTQHALQRAKYSSEFDPINNCLGIYMDTINIFINMVNILAGGNKRR